MARTIPVVVLTAAELDSTEREMLRERVLGLIDKQGLDRDALIREVQRVLPLAETRAAGRRDDRSEASRAGPPARAWDGP